MAKCQDCQEQFPAQLVQRTVIGPQNYDLCGVCALIRIRALHGRNAKDFQFHGPIAKGIYEMVKKIKLNRGTMPEGLP